MALANFSSFKLKKNDKAHTTSLDVAVCQIYRIKVEVTDANITKIIKEPITPQNLTTTATSCHPCLNINVA